MRKRVTSFFTCLIMIITLFGNCFPTYAESNILPNASIEEIVVNSEDDLTALDEEKIYYPTMGISIDGERIDVPQDGAEGSNANLPELFKNVEITFGGVTRTFSSDTVGRPGFPLVVRFTNYPNSIFTEDVYTYEVKNIPEGYTYEMSASEQHIIDGGIKVDGTLGNIFIHFKKSSGGSSGSGGSSTTKYMLSYESNGGTEYKDERYVAGTTVKLDKAPTRKGYTFTGWYENERLTDKISRIRMDKNKTIYAGWEKISMMSELHIPDILNGDKHLAYITGYTDGTVRPLNDITRAEVAMIFYRLLKDDVRESNKTTYNTFEDVTDDMWYNTAISTIASLDIVNGRSTTVFEPNAPITRAELATICARFDTSDIQEKGMFSDIGDCWAKAYIERAASLGWVNGYSDGTFRPDNKITRAEAMTMINLVMGRLPETTDDLLAGMKSWPDNPDSSWYYLHVQEATNSHEFERKANGVHEIQRKAINENSGVIQIG